MMSCNNIGPGLFGGITANRVDIAGIFAAAVLGAIERVDATLAHLLAGNMRNRIERFMRADPDLATIIAAVVLGFSEDDIDWRCVDRVLEFAYRPPLLALPCSET